MLLNLIYHEGSKQTDPFIESVFDSFRRSLLPWNLFLNQEKWKQFLKVESNPTGSVGIIGRLKKILSDEQAESWGKSWDLFLKNSQKVSNYFEMDKPMMFILNHHSVSSVDELQTSLKQSSAGWRWSGRFRCVPDKKNNGFRSKRFLPLNKF